MATTGVIHVKDLTVYKSSTAYACAQDASLEVNNALREILCKDTSGWKTFKDGVKDWSMQVSGLFAYDHTLGGEELLTDLIAGTEITVRFSTEVTGDTYYEGTAYVSNVSLNSSGGAGETATYSATFTGSGAITSGTVA